MRRFVPLFVCLLLVLGALPLVAGEDGPLDAAVRAFLAEANPEVRLVRGLSLVHRAPDVPALAAAVQKGWAWESETVKGEPISWIVTTDDGIEHTVFAYAPPSYTAEKAWPLLLWMHGGVAREEDGGGRGAIENFKEDAEAKGYLLLAPSTQKDAMWWTPRGVALLREALMGMKRRYRVDADRVAAAGFSDGGSACFHLLLHDPDPYCCFLAFVGTPLSSRLMGGPSWAQNLGTRPVYAVNGGKDRLFPSEALIPFMEEMKANGANLTWHDEPELGHDYALLEKRWEEACAFWQAHSREPLPKRITWTTARPEGEGRHGWVEITEIFSAARKAKDLEPPKELTVPDLRRPRLGIRMRREFPGPGVLIETVEESTPADGVFEDGDVILQAGEVEFLRPEDLALLPQYLRGLGEEEDGVFRVKRGDQELELRARPRILAKDRPARPEELGYDVPRGTIVAEVKDGNVIDVQTHGVLTFRLHLSPDLVDFSKPLKVRINGESRPLYEGAAPTNAAYVLAEAVRQGPGAPITLGFLAGEVSVPRAVSPTPESGR